MDEQYDIQIEGITKAEYVQAGTEIIRRMIVPLILLVAAATLIIALFIDDFSLRSLLPPFVVALLAPVVMWASVVHSWKKFPAGTSFSYLIDREGWQLTVGESSANIDWQDTVRMTVRSHVVLLFHESNRSNILPRRCLTPEQLAQLRAWFDDSRTAHKARQKEQDEQFRKDYRMKRLEAKANRRSPWKR